jgi:hypothetical protein
MTGLGKYRESHRRRLAGTDVMVLAGSHGVLVVKDRIKSSVPARQHGRTRTGRGSQAERQA